MEIKNEEMENDVMEKEVMNGNENNMEMNNMAERLDNLIALAGKNNALMAKQVAGLVATNCDEQALYILTLKMDQQLETLDAILKPADNQVGVGNEPQAKTCPELGDHILGANAKFNSQLDLMKTQSNQIANEELVKRVMVLDLFTQEQNEWLQEIKELVQA
ncbi:MAG: hypothetical protein PHU33_17470 [Bacteroidales bacterium]|nr:hypothetical protein [Bacteroidales bacterium]